MERLNKLLAHAGVGSRRHVEDLIAAGRVTVDGRPVRELGTKVDPEAQRVAVDGQPVKLERPVYWAVNKPPGYWGELDTLMAEAFHIIAHEAIPVEYREVA